MKKLLLVLGILTIGINGYADAKSDYENAINISREGRLEEAVKKLEEISRGNDKVYMAKANFQLGYYYLQGNDGENVKKYMSLALNNLGLNDDEKLMATRIMYSLTFQEGDTVSAERYLKSLEQLDKGEKTEYLVNALRFYLMQNRTKEGMELYNKVVKGKYSDEAKAIINYAMADIYLENNNKVEGEKYLTEAYKFNNSVGNNAGIELYNLAILGKNDAKAEKILLDLDKRTNSSNDVVTNMIGLHYYVFKNYAKSEVYFKKLEKKYPDFLEIQVPLMGIYENTGNNGNAKKYYDMIKNTAKEETNRFLGNEYLMVFGDLKLGEKYLRKAVNEDKNNDARIDLINYYIQTGKVQEAKLELKEAVKLKIPGASETLKQLETIK